MCHYEVPKDAVVEIVFEVKLKNALPINIVLHAGTLGCMGLQ